MAELMRIKSADSQPRQLLIDRFGWKNGKPEPFEHLRKRSEYHWEKAKGESHCIFIDRLHKHWEELEQETYHELWEIPSQWSGNCLYAFDHTTHQSVEDSVKEYEKSGRWAPRKVAAKPKATGRSKGAKDSGKPEEEDDNEPDGGDTPGKPQRKTRKRSRDDEDDGPSGEPASKKSKATLAVRGRRQMRTTI